MPSNENHVKVIKILLETPEATLASIGEQIGASATTVHKVIQEINTIYTEKLLKEEEDIPATMAANYDGQITTEEMLKVLDIVERRVKKVNNKSETKENTSDMSGFSNDNSNNSPGLEIDTTTKCLQLVLSNFKGKNISNERISGIVNLYRAQEFKYKKEPWLIRPMLVNILGAGLGEEAFKQFMDLVQYYVPPADGFTFNGNMNAPNHQQPAIDPAMVAMMSNGDPSVAAMMTAMGSGGGASTSDFFQKMMLMDMMEERRRKREREDRELQDKELERRLAIKREQEEAKDRQMMQMMMIGMMKNGNGDNGGIPPGYAAETTIGPDGQPITKLIPLPAYGAQAGQNPAEMFKSMVEVAKLVQPQQQGNSKADELLASLATGAIQRLNVQTDPLESAARAIEMADKLRPPQQPSNAYEEINAKIALLDKEMEWKMKAEERAERMHDKELAQQNTKGYIETIERVATNVAAPLVEKVAQGYLRGQAPPAAGQTQVVAQQQPQVEIENMPTEKLEQILRQGEEMELQNKQVKDRIAETLKKRRQEQQVEEGAPGPLDGVDGGNDGESNMQGSSSHVDVNIR